MSYNMYNADARSAPYAGAGEMNLGSIMRQVYLWLTLGLAVGFGVSFVLGQIALNEVAAGQTPLLANSTVVLIGIVAYLGVGFTFYPIVRRASLAVGALLYLGFTALFGFLISSIWIEYKASTIFSAFVTTAAMFGVMSIIGYTTKINLAKFGPILFMGLIGVIIASLVNLFLHNSTIYWIVTYAAVVIFTGLIAYDTQWIRKNAAAIANSGDGQAAGRIALIGAFRLFLDFVNLFLNLLRIFGGRR